MDKPFASTSNESRLSHKKRLHFILFIDAAQTRSFSLKMQHAWWLLGGVLFFIAASITTGVVLVKTYQKLKTTQNHLVDVKRALFAESVADRNILSSEFISGDFNDKKSQTVKAIIDELGHLSSPTAGVAIATVVPKPDIKKDLKATVKKPESAVRSGGTQDEIIGHAASKQTVSTSGSAVVETPSKVAEKVIPKVELPPTAVQESAVQISPVKFENIVISDDEDEPGTINVSFDLQNVSGRTLTGWVCAAVTLKNSDGGQQLRAAPSSVSLSTNSQAIKSCKGGEFVKFNRLRPTTLTTAGNQTGVEKVVVYFTDGASGRQYSDK